MIDDILKAGITRDLQEKMIDTLGYGEVLNLACNYENVRDIINLLKLYGIKQVENIILNKEYIFEKNVSDLVKSFGKFNIPLLVDLINEDYNVIDEVFEA